MKLLCKLYYLCDTNYYEGFSIIVPLFIFQANAIQLWKDLPKCFTNNELKVMELGYIKNILRKVIIISPKDFYKTHLFFFEKFSKSNKTPQDLKEIISLDIGLITDPYIKYAYEMRLTTLPERFIDEVDTF